MQRIWVGVNKARAGEFADLYEFGCFQRWPRHRSSNVIAARCVIIWKMVERNVGVKCRSTARGFKGKFQDSDTYTGTTPRSGQRLVNVVVAEKPGFILFSFDVSQVFAKGMAFEELSALSGQDVRKG